MQHHHADPGIFIRSMATRGVDGRAGARHRRLALLLDAAGMDYVIIETVGVGQDEVEIAGVAQVTVVVLVPGMGDDIQAIKAGILEIADIFVINKADHPGADRVEQEIHAKLANAARRAHRRHRRHRHRGAAGGDRSRKRSSQCRQAAPAIYN